jgi:CelD/BcsL family acetyltransferase involved in cellulose biosynthesis
VTSIATARAEHVGTSAEASAEVMFARTADEAAAHVCAWDDLATAAGEPNAFCESWFVLAALRRLTTDNVRVAFVYGRDSGGRRVMCGVFPLQLASAYKRLPLRCWKLWKHDYCFLGVPLVRTGHETEALSALIRALRSNREGGGLLELGMLTAEGPFRRSIDAWATQTRQALLVTDRYERALLNVPASYDSYFHDTFDRKRRKEFVRQGNRLREVGPVATVCSSPHVDPALQIDEFLELEASGWKGRDGTALAAREADRAFLREAATEAHRRGRLMLLALRVGGKPVAMKLNWMAGDGGFAFKIAYDEAWAAYSPGLLLELANVQRLAEDGRARWMDSCADADHFMANRIWPGRRAIESVLVPLHAGGAWTVRLLGLLQKLKSKRRNATRGASDAARVSTGVES